jgi:hypothetical protein
VETLLLLVVQVVVLVQVVQLTLGAPDQLRNVGGLAVLLAALH